MSCFFCDSDFHLSQYCHVRSTIKSRKEAAKFKKCCKFCLSPFSVEHRATWQNKCDGLRKCYICFTKDHHHTVFCSNNASNFFVPNIDRILFPRFFSCLDLTHQYSLLFSCLQIYDTVKFGPIKVTENKKIESKIVNSDTDFIVHHELSLNEIRFTKLGITKFEMVHFFRTNIPVLSVKMGLIEPRILKIQNSLILHEEIFYLLSFRTKEISITNVFLMVTLGYLLRRAPNVESIELHNTTIYIPKITWPKILLDLKKGKNFRLLKMEIDGYIHFDVEPLKEFLQKKCQKHVKVVLNIKAFASHTSYEDFEQTLSENFHQINAMFMDENPLKPSIQITYPYRNPKYYTF